MSPTSANTMSLVGPIEVGGKTYDPEWGRRMKGEGPFADLVAHRFAIACKKLGLATDLPPLRTDLFKPPARPGDQLSLF